MSDKRSRFGCILQLRGRDGWWFRKRIGTKTYVRYAGRTETAGRKFQSKVWTLFQDGCSIEEALARASGKPAPCSNLTTMANIAELYETAMKQEGRKKRQTQARDAGRIGIIKEAPWADTPLEHLERGDVRSWVTRRMAAGVSAGTCNNDLSLCSAILKHAADVGWVDDDLANPFLRCRIRRVIRKKRAAFDLDETRCFLQHAKEVCDVEAYSFLVFGTLSGWRLGDGAQLTVADVDLDYVHKGRPAPRITLSPEDEKQGAVKVVYLAGPLLQEVEARMRRRLPGALLFVQPNGSSWADPKRVNGWIRKVVKAIPDDEIPGWKKDGNSAYAKFTYHCLRHTCRTILAELEFPLHVIDGQVGHNARKQLDMAHHYTAVPDAALIDIALKVAEALTDDGQTASAGEA